MKPRLTAPYYLSGNSERRWHANQSENGAVTAASAGALGYAAHNPKYHSAARNFLSSKGIHLSEEHMHTGGKAAYGVAGVAGAYSAFHAVQANRKARRVKKVAKWNG